MKREKFVQRLVAVNQSSRFLKLALSVGLLGAAASASAQVAITSSNDPALAIAGLITFTSSTPGTYLSLSLGAVTFSGSSGLVVESLYGGNYNSIGNYINNNNDASSLMTFSFSSGLAAFGFNYGATDDPWTLSAYDAGSNLIYATIVAPIGGSSAGEFIGIASPSANIAYATFKDDGGIWFPDWILVDNFKFTEVVTVPEPGSLSLCLFTLATLGFAVRRRRLT